MLPKESKFFGDTVALVESAKQSGPLSVAQQIKLAELCLNLACLDAGLARLGWFRVDGSGGADLYPSIAVSPGAGV